MSDFVTDQSFTGSGLGRLGFIRTLIMKSPAGRIHEICSYFSQMNALVMFALVHRQALMVNAAMSVGDVLRARMLCDHPYQAPDCSMHGPHDVVCFRELASDGTGQKIM